MALHNRNPERRNVLCGVERERETSHKTRSNPNGVLVLEHSLAQIGRFVGPLTTQNACFRRLSRNLQNERLPLFRKPESQEKIGRVVSCGITLLHLFAATRLT